MTAISRRIAALVVAALLAILTAGLPAAPAAATAVEVVNLGITSYRPQPDGPDDPALQRLRRVDDYYATPRYQAFERDLVAQAEAAGLEVVSLERATGVFGGAFEPSASVDVRGDPDAVAALAVDLGRQYQQGSVLTFEAAPGGPDAFYLLDGVGECPLEIRRAVRLMTELGFLGGRFVDGRLEIGDPGGSMAPQAAQLAHALHAELEIQAGILQFLDTASAAEEAA